MSRSYATNPTAIWADPRFRAVSRSAKGTYWMLVTQPDISAAGRLSLALRRWVRLFPDATVETLTADLNELHAAGFVLVDWDTDEALSLSFIRDDNGYGNRRRRPVIERACGEIESVALRRAMIPEFASLGLPVEWLNLPNTQGPDSLSGSYTMPYPDSGDSPSDSPSERPNDTPEPAAAGTDKSAFPQVDSLSDALCRSDGVVVTQEGVVRPQPSTHNQQPPPSEGLFAAPPAANPAPPPRQRKPANDSQGNAGLVVAAYCEGATKAGLDSPSKTLCGRVGRSAKALIGEGKNFDLLIRAATEMGGSGFNDLDTAYRRAEITAKGAADRYQQGRRSGELGRVPAGRLVNSHANVDRYDEPI